MKKPTLTLAMIVRDVEQYITPCLDSILPYVNEIVVSDTGSEDRSCDVIHECARRHKTPFIQQSFNEGNAFVEDQPSTFDGVAGSENLKHFSGKKILANYSAARQATFDSATSDYILWIDSDDIVQGGENIEKVLQTMVEKSLDTAFFEYDYEKNEKGVVVTRLTRARIIRKGGPSRWIGAVHETLAPLGRTEIFDSVHIVHRAHELLKKTSSAARPPLRNFKILLWDNHRLESLGKPIPPRNWFYLGNEARQFDAKLAVDFLEKYVSLSDWNEEKAQALTYVGMIKEGAGDWQGARGQYAAASAVFPDKPETHFGLARIAAYLKDHEACVRHHEAGEVAVWRKRDTLHYNPLDRNFFPALCDAQSFIETGNHKKALRIADAALKINPDSIHLKTIQHLATKKISERRHKRSIIIWTGNALEKWTSENINTTGIGGSETAAALMARELVKLGHDVSIYANCGDKAGTYDGVKYVHFEEVENGPLQCDIFISSRSTAIFEADIKAAWKILWLHDMDVGPATNVSIASNLLKADYYFCLSNWHKDKVARTYPFIDPKKILVTRNGIDVSRFKDEPKKIGNRLIYSSSPDRGLGVLLEIFPQIRERVKDAELHIYYGFHNFEKLLDRHPDVRLREKGHEEISRMKGAIASTPGVTMKGRVGQTELAQAMLQAKIFAYSSWFEETSCISAMEAQAAACLPITTALAALNETVHHGFLLKPPATSDKYKTAYVNRVVWALTNEEERAQIAARGRQEALKLHPWSRVAEEWDDMFAKVLQPSKS